MLNVRYRDSETCLTCGHTTGGEKVMRVYDTNSGREAGMFDDGPDLYEYELKDGRKIFEVVQAVPWSGGPCIFLCLELDSGERIGEWSQEELDNA